MRGRSTSPHKRPVPSRISPLPAHVQAMVLFAVGSASRIAPISSAQVRQVLLISQRLGAVPRTWIREETVGTGTVRIR